jgi:2-iminobutanoate/2-iminopropanoate deaminase
VTRSAVRTEGAPAPVAGAPYSQAIVAAGLVFVSGQVPVNPTTGRLVDGGIAEHTHRCFDNVEAILAEAGTGLDRLVKTSVFLRSIADFAGMNAVYAERVPAPYPARAAVEVSELPVPGALVEIEVVALAGA